MALQKSPLLLLLDRVPKPFRNKYVLVMILFFGWMLIFDSANLITQWKLGQSVNKLEDDKAYYQGKIREAEKDKKLLEENKERYAREKYHMHKDKEEVFIIEEE